MTSDEMRERAYVIASVSDMSADAVMKLMAFVLEEAAKVADECQREHVNEGCDCCAASDAADAIRALKPTAVAGKERG